LMMIVIPRTITVIMEGIREESNSNSHA
jgi:hypothetical protein